MLQLPIKGKNRCVLCCPRCKTPAIVGSRCHWCGDYPELDSNGKLRVEISERLMQVPVTNDVAAHFCKSLSCANENTVAVGQCFWCNKFNTGS